MKFLVKLLPVLALASSIGFAATASEPSTGAQVKSARPENVSQCFVVREMYKSHDIRYYVDATSHCAHAYDAVYVMVSFLDHAGKLLSDGMWAIYWCRPGLREVHEFGVPAAAAGFEKVIVRKISTNIADAM